MKYIVELKPKAIKDIRHLQKTEEERIIDALKLLEDDMKGDIKKLTNFTPEYRLRVGKYRILFEVEDRDRIIVYRVMHRKDVYR